MTDEKKKVVQEDFSPITFKRQSQAAEIWRRYRKSKGAVIGLVLLIIIALLLVFAEQIAPYERAIYQDANAILAKPSAEHIFGCDGFGRDVLPVSFTAAAFPFPLLCWQRSLPAPSAALWVLSRAISAA